MLKHNNLTEGALVLDNFLKTDWYKQIEAAQQVYNILSWFYKGDAVVIRLIDHDGPNVLNQLITKLYIMWKPKHEVSDEDFEELRNLFQIFSSILWSACIHITPENEIEGNIFKKTRKTLRLSDFLKENSWIIFKNYVKYQKIDLSKESEIIDKIVQEITAEDDPMIEVHCPGDFANFINNAFANAYINWKATQVELQYNQGLLSVLDNGTGIDEIKFPKADEIFISWKSGSDSTGLWFWMIDKRWIVVEAEHHGGLPSHNSVGNNWARINIAL